LISLAILVAAAVSSSAATGFTGVARVGYVFIDDEGDRGAQQSTYNLYEGPALSLEDFEYYSANGVRFFGDFRNLTLNNRNLTAGLTKRGSYGMTLRNYQYRRTYSAEGDSFTRRRRTSVNVWVQAHRYVRLYGGFGLTGKKGRLIELFEPGVELGRREVDYTQTDWKAGIAYKYQTYHLDVEMRGSKFSDDLYSVNDRNSIRYEVTAGGSLPNREELAFYAGFQRYESRLTDGADSLKANSVWGGMRYHTPFEWTLKGGFVFDRARRTGDLTATDDISYYVRAGRDWLGYGGLTVGYRYRINDDVLNEVSSNSYSVGVWAKPIPLLLLRAGYGSEAKEVKSGRTLTGNEDRERYYVSARYDIKRYGYVRIKHAARNIDNDQIGSSAEYMQAAVDLSLHDADYGELQAAYALLDGEYVNGGGVFGFKDHVVSGDLMSRTYRDVRAGFGFTYMRGKEDVDIESSVLRFSVTYDFMVDHQLQVRYNVHNFDDLADPSPIYSRYYTANIVEVSVAKRF
jgi:hypothetical protein